MAKWYEKAIEPFIPSETVRKMLTEEAKAPSTSAYSTAVNAGKVLPKAYDDITGKTTAKRVEKAQTDALNKAMDYQTQMYQESKGYLDPYQQVGQDFLLGQKSPSVPSIEFVNGRPVVKMTGGQRSGGLADMIKGGDFLQDDFSYSDQRPDFEYGGQQPGAFSYGGQQPGAFSYGGKSLASKVDYSGSQPSEFSYSGAGQSANTGYTGGPIDRSIESYMKDDPSLAWQQEQMEKAINRQAAAKGRWGGGATAREMMRETAGLLSQDYGNRFNRAAMERYASVGAETDKYGRSLTGLGLKNLAEQSQYDRDFGKYGLDVDRERDAYGRALTDTNLYNLASQDDYGRSQYGYQTGVDREADAYNRERYGYETGVDREADAYNRSTQQYGFDVLGEQTKRDRMLEEYGIQGQNLQNKLNQYTAMANLGPQMAQSLANAAQGQGGALSNLSIQQGNVTGASKAAQGTLLSNLLELGKTGAQIYGAAG